MWRLPSFQSFLKDHDGSLKGMDIAGEGQNATMIQFFSSSSPTDGRHYKDFVDNIPHLAGLGFTCVWLPPPSKAMHSEGYGYDSYDLWDLGEFDTHGYVRTRWGTKDELIRATSAAAEAGLRPVVDAVLNHKMGGDRLERFLAVEVDPKDRRVEIAKPREVEGWTAFDFPGRNGKYSMFKWSSQHFTGIDHDCLSGKSGIFRMCGDGHKGWSRNVDSENGNFDYLLGTDIDHSHPDVCADLFSWGTWVLNEIPGSVGFRLDACKHVDRVFIRDFIRHVRTCTGRSKLVAVGELWVYSAEAIERYVRFFNGLVAFFDVPLHFNFHRASRTKNYDLRNLISGSLLAKRPGDAVTFVDNHDTQMGASLESWVSASFKQLAYAFILLWPLGFPCVFHGDLYGLDGRYPSDPIPNLDKLIVARKLFAHGPMKAYFDHKSSIGFVRLGTATRDGCAVVLRNSPDGPSTKLMNVGANNADTSWTDILGYGTAVLISKKGVGRFACPAHGVAVWIREDARGRMDIPRG